MTQMLSKLLLIVALGGGMRMTTAQAQQSPASAQAAKAPAAAATAEAPAPRAVPTPVLVELFTSEGCSSCPPADQLMARLNGSVTATGQRVIVLSEHVTYWDKGGWKDPFSSSLFTDRQGQYSENFGLEENYTPQAVIDGIEEGVASEEPAVLGAIADAARLPLPLTLQVMSYAASGANLAVVFTVQGPVPPQGTAVVAALTDQHDQTAVQGGENEGRTLRHVNVVRSWARTVVLRPGEQTLVMLPVPAAARATPPGGRALVLFAQAAGQGRVLGVATQPVDVEFPTVRPRSTATSGRTLKPR